MSGPSSLTRLAEIDRDLAAASPAIRFRPLSRAIWRALLLTPTELAALVANPEGLATFDRLAVAVVGRAILGDVKAANTVADMIEGRAGLRRGDVPVKRKGGSGALAPAMELSHAQRDEMIESLRDLYERVE